MMFEDKNGRTWYPEEVDSLTPWEVEELGIHMAEGSNWSPRRHRRARETDFAV